MLPPVGPQCALRRRTVGSRMKFAEAVELSDWAWCASGPHEPDARNEAASVKGFARVPACTYTAGPVH